MRRFVRCPECEGDSVENAEVGGIVEGGCDLCDGTGLVDPDEVEKGTGAGAGGANP